MRKQIKKLISTIIFFSSFGIISQNSFAAITAADELSQLLNKIHTMQATFEQSLINQQGIAIETKTKGKMILNRPGKFRWETIQPNRQLIIINQHQMLLYDPDLAQLIKRKVDYNRPGNPAMLLSSSVTFLKQSFQITKAKKTGQGLWFKLTPKLQKNQERDYQWIEINFIDGQLKAMYIFDNLEQTSFINFNNIVLNANIPSKAFIFSPPPNTEIFNS